MSLPTLLDIAKANGSDGVVGLIDETTQSVPEVRLGAARTIKGTSYKTLVRTKLPTVSFRNANEGTNADKGTYENRTVETFIFEPRWECDKAVADRYEDGPESFITMEASGIMQAAFQHVGGIFYYGTAKDAKAFPGLIEAYDTANMEVDAGGDDGNGSSVWAVRFGVQDIQWVYGEGGQLSMSDVAEETLTDDEGKKFKGYVQNMLAYPGLQVASKYSCARIKNLTEQAGKGLTDDLIASLLNKFPAGKEPQMLLMNRRSREQLRASRTATSATGAPAPIPTEVFGVPIAPTESLVNNEATA